MARVCEALWCWVFVGSGSGHPSVKRRRFDRGPQQTGCGRRTFSGSPLCVMEEKVYGSLWDMISPLLTTDDAVMLRTVTRRWNEENKHGALGYAFFMMLKLDQYENKWHYGSDGNRVCTMLRKCNPMMDSIRRRGLHPPQEETPPIGLGEVDTTSFGDAVMALSGNQVAEAHLCTRLTALGATPSLPTLISSGSMSPGLGEMWRYACPKSPETGHPNGNLLR